MGSGTQSTFKCRAIPSLPPRPSGQDLPPQFYPVGLSLHRLTVSSKPVPLDLFSEQVLQTRDGQLSLWKMQRARLIYGKCTPASVIKNSQRRSVLIFVGWIVKAVSGENGQQVPWLEGGEVLSPLEQAEQWIESGSLVLLRILGKDPGKESIICLSMRPISCAALQPV